jgi:uncharacterized protein (TIGR02646 family)
MKRLHKKEPLFFKEFIRQVHPVEWYQLSEIRESIRTYILSGLVPNEAIEPNTNAEQNFQCAYTEIDIEPDSYSSHIDHFRKQSLFPALRFDWDNIFVSTNSNYYGAKYKDNKYRIQQNGYQYLINPATENPGDYFKFSFTGEILMKEKDEKSIQYIKAKKTIEIFNLNERSLTEHRATVAKTVIAYFGQLTVGQIKTNIGRFDNFIEYIYIELSNLQEHI